MGPNDDRPDIEGEKAEVTATITGATEPIRNEAVGIALVPDFVRVLYVVADHGGWEAASITVSGQQVLKDGITGSERTELPIATDDQEMPYWLQVWVEDTMPEVSGLYFSQSSSTS